MQMRRYAPWSLAAAALAAGLALAGCSKDSDLPTTPAPTASVGEQECGAANVVRPADFSRPTVINNRWFPLTPGTRFTLTGRSNRGGGLLPHTVVFTVTDLTKTIHGVNTLIMWDLDYNNDVLAEAELAFFAQDDFGNIWTFGEYPEEYENGSFAGAPSTWMSGIANAEAGILLPGDPTTGRKFLQGYAPDVNFLDCAVVNDRSERFCGFLNCYTNALVIYERSPLEPGSGIQIKYYAPGVGNFQIGALNDPEGETLVLTSFEKLSPAEMATARAEVLKLETHAYQVNDTYRGTAPISVPVNAPVAGLTP
jgi:hypothetical protein